MLHQLRPAVGILVLLTALTGLVYPLAVTGASQAVFGHEADGSRIVVDGEVRGSSLLAQPFDGDEWFHPRPSAVGHDAGSSGASNLGPDNPELLDEIERRTEEYRAVNDLADEVPVPIDAVTASGSGLDPHISPRNARLQAARVARTRGLDHADVLALVDQHVERRTASILGEQRVNAVLLNLALSSLRG
jgi:potassium-transporting ATPase KdpC subunit